MDFVIKALDHVAGNVRETAVDLLVDIHQNNIRNGGSPNDVRSLLPYSQHDLNAIKKSQLWRSIYDRLDLSEGKQTQAQIKQQKLNEQKLAEEKKKKEIDALQEQIAQLKTMQADVGKGKQMKESNFRESVPEIEEEIEEQGDENICIFCGEKDANFNEQGLDLHYWKHCPM